MHRDPVCGRRMNPNRAHAKIMYEGVMYLLCCPRCQSEFESAPARYAAEDKRGRRKQAPPAPRRRP